MLHLEIVADLHGPTAKLKTAEKSTNFSGLSDVFSVGMRAQ